LPHSAREQSRRADHPNVPLQGRGELGCQDRRNPPQQHHAQAWTALDQRVGFVRGAEQHNPRDARSRDRTADTKAKASPSAQAISF